MLNKRVSIVHHLNVIDITSSSVLQVGDTRHIAPRTRALAVQREAEMFFGNEGNFSDYPVFTKDIPRPEAYDVVRVSRVNQSPFIKVNTIDITGVAASSVCQVGSNSIIDSESRIKHIRQLLNDDAQSDPGE